jgi:squalene-hopene/tetraprenyl-beta-curcumene cyclase
VEFLKQSVRSDGSWPIDTNLSTWVTTLAVNALATAGEVLKLEKSVETRKWLVAQQYQERHPYTGAAPGAWAWTPLPGSVPDADDTAGALLSLANLTTPAEEKEVNGILLRYGYDRKPVFTGPVRYGISWLANLQNTDGGWPTFCRGWTKLPFDRSGADLTAHALRARLIWLRRWHGENVYRGSWGCYSDSTVPPGLRFLQYDQRPDGSWLPLWFGCQHAPDDINPTYGTARVLAAYRDLDRMKEEPAQRGVRFLLSIQNADGGWGGAAQTPSTMEETALAVEILLDGGPETIPAVNKGLLWLVEQVEAGRLHDAAPIGFYFAKLWYYEKLYPIIFTVAALGRARRKLSTAT